MKFQADREVLADAISFVVRMLSPKPQLPQLSGVMITAKDNEVVLSVFDYEVSAKVVIAAAVDKERSNGCAFADSPAHVPIQRMPNVSLQANPTGPTLEKLIESVEDGIYILGDKSWSIDMQRYNFQFTGQQFHRIKNGKIVGQLKDVAYQATTTDFWGSMKTVGGPSTYVLGGAFNCGKAQPGQIAAVSHGCPAAVFDKVNVLNTVAEASK
jgi:TldD protein